MGDYVVGLGMLHPHNRHLVEGIEIDRQSCRLDLFGGDRAHPKGQLDQRGASKRRIDCQMPGKPTDDRTRLGHARRSLDSSQDGQDQVLLTPRAADVIGIDGYPVAVAKLLVVTRPGIGQGLGPVEQLVSSVDRQTAFGVTRRVRKIDVDPSDVIDQRLKTDKVHFDVMVNREAGHLLHRADHEGSAANGIRSVDPIGPFARDLDQQIPWQREDLNMPVVGIELDQHDYIATGPCALPEVLEAVEAGTGVRPDHQEDERIGRLGGPQSQLRNHLFELGGVVTKGVLGRTQSPIHREHGNIGEDEKDDDQALDPGRGTSMFEPVGAPVGLIVGALRRRCHSGIEAHWTTSETLRRLARFHTQSLLGLKHRYREHYPSDPSSRAETGGSPTPRGNLFDHVRRLPGADRKRV